MGGVLSTNHLTETVTLNRIRQVCQKDSTLPYKVRLHHVELLANDLNKLGFEIPIKDSKGNAIPVDKVCDRVSDVLPNVESVCMYNVKNKGDLHSGIKSLVNHFNKHYGANIQMYKNIFGPKNKDNLRPYENICDDLYMAQDRIYRNLSDYPDMIKNRLRQAISLLGSYKNALDADFDNYLVSMASSRQTDQVAKTMRSVKALRQSMSGMLQKQLDTLEQNYQNIMLAHKNKIGPLLGQAQIYRNHYPGISFKPIKKMEPTSIIGFGNKNKGDMKGGFGFNLDLMQSIGTFDNKLNSLMLPSIFLGSAAEQCQECLSKFNISVDEFYKKPEYERQAIVMNKYLPKIAQARREGRGEREIVRILECAKQLLDDKDANNCARAIVGHSSAYEASKDLMNPNDRCKLLSADPNICGRDPDCYYDPGDSTCKSDEEAINKFAQMMSKPIFDQQQSYGDIPNGDDEQMLAYNNLPAISGPSGITNIISGYPATVIPQSGILPMSTFMNIGGRKKRKSKKGRKKTKKGKTNRKKKSSKRGRRKSRGKK